MPVSLKNKEKYTSLISPKKDLKNPLYNWHAFKHGFSKDLVFNLLKDLKLKKDSWILDPFCGGGTTLLTSKQNGINSIGIDILPFSVFLSNVKIRDYNVRTLIKEYEKINKCIQKSISVVSKMPIDIPLLEKAFRPGIRIELERIKHFINEIDKRKYKDFFNLAFLSTLEKVSNTSKDGGFLRIIDRNVVSSTVNQIFLKRCESMISDIRLINNEYHLNGIRAEAKLGDARNINLRKSFDAIITSPPYLNRHDYTRIYALEMVFDFVTNNNELKEIRYNTLRSHVEAKKKFEPYGYSEPKRLIKLKKSIIENGLNNPQIPDMISGYFEDMFICLQQMKDRLNKGGKIALVVSNVRFAGINIPVDTLLSEIGQQVGLKQNGIWIIRNRGNSSQQMKNFLREPSRESIILWRK